MTNGIRRPRLPRSLGAVLAIALGTWACGNNPGAGTEPVGVEAAGSSGEDAPDFTLPGLSGDTTTLSALRGKTVIIDFWATWCPPCEFQVPELNAFYETHGPSGDVEVLGISVDTEGPEVVEKWSTEKDVRYPVLLGDEALARRYGAVGFPTLVIVDPEGNIESRHVGLIEVADIEDAFERIRSARAGS